MIYKNDNLNYLKINFFILILIMASNMSNPDKINSEKIFIIHYPTSVNVPCCDNLPTKLDNLTIVNPPVSLPEPSDDPFYRPFTFLICVMMECVMFVSVNLI